MLDHRQAVDRIFRDLVLDETWWCLVLGRLKDSLFVAKGERDSLNAQSSPCVHVLCVCECGCWAESRGSDSQCQIACRGLNNDCMSDATFPLSPGLECIWQMEYGPRGRRYLKQPAAAYLKR